MTLPLLTEKQLRAVNRFFLIWSALFAVIVTGSRLLGPSLGWATVLALAVAATITRRRRHPLNGTTDGGRLMNGVRRYRLRIYDGGYEVLHNRTYSVDLDLESPTHAGILDRKLVALTREALAANEPMALPRLEVCDWVTGVKVMDWTGA